MNKLLSIPGAAWVALIALLAAWLEQYFPNELWLAAALGGLGLIAKAIEVFWPRPEPSATDRLLATQPDTTTGKVWRVFLGG